MKNKIFVTLTLFILLGLMGNSPEGFHSETENSTIDMRIDRGKLIIVVTGHTNPNTETFPLLSFSGDLKIKEDD